VANEVLVEGPFLRYTPFGRVCRTHNLNSWRLMSKEDSIEVTGTVVEKFPSGLFSVQLDQDRTVLAHLAGKLRRNRIRVLAGDRVTLEMSPYDLTKGRITYRHK
jgi:translation initiation factor IF-1